MRTDSSGQDGKQLSAEDFTSAAAPLIALLYGQYGETKDAPEAEAGTGRRERRSKLV